MKKVIYGLLTSVLCVSFLLMAVGSSSSSSSRAESGSSTSASSQTSSSSSQVVQSSKEETSSKVSTTEKNNVFKVGETLDAGGLKITMEKVEKYESDNQFLQPGSGNIYFRAYFSIKNESNADKTVGSMDFDCYADGVACDSKYFSEDDSLTSIDTISSNRSIKGYVYYEIPESSQEIEIEYETSWWKSEKAIFKVEL